MRSLVSVPRAGGPGSWSFPPGTRQFDVRVALDGRARVRVRLELRSLPDGRVVHSDDQQHDVDGSLELTFPDVSVPAAGRYELSLEVQGPGVRQSSKVSVTTS